MEKFENEKIFGGDHYDLDEVQLNRAFITVLEGIRKNRRKVSMQLKNFVQKAQKLGNKVTL